MAGLKKYNEYSEMITDGLYDKTPKAVFAAIVVSEYINRLNLEPAELNQAILVEWQTLYQNGIIPQRPPNKALEPSKES